MGLESVSFISDLVNTWPLGTDKIRDGDNHLRNIKRAIQNTFPNYDEAVTVPPSALNSLPANFQAVLAELLEHIVPLGAILAWSGAIGTIPAGWALCNGQTVVGFGVVPDLRDRFLVGAGNLYAVNGTGGQVTATSTNDGAHTPVAQGTAISEAQLPAHNHRIWAWAGNQSGDVQDSFQQPATNTVIAGESTPSSSQYLDVNTAGTPLTEDTGGGQTHTHTMNDVPDHNHDVDVLPPYYALAYIIKVTTYVAP